MAIASVATNLSARPGRPPGVYIEAFYTPRTGVPVPATGVPAFIGFADPPASGQRLKTGGVAINSWNATDFDLTVAPVAGSFLPMAVRGFFANGGKRCIVIPVAPARGAEGLRDVLQAGGPLDDRCDIDLVCIPDAVRERCEDADLYNVHEAALAHCESMGDRFAVLDAHDPIRGDRHLPVDAVLSEAASLKSSFGALYFPWVGTDRAAGTLGLMAPAPGSQEWRRPAPASETRVHGGLLFGPPCGHIAGLIARTDAVFGPQRSPANLRLDDAIDVSVSLSAEQQALLNEHGVNFLRGRRGSGVEVGAARTLRRDSAWAYVSTARVILCFRRWLEAGMREFVFESNTPELWDRIGLRLTAKCSEMWREGGLAGGDPAGAFFVKCDAETNSADDVERGCVIAEVGLAPSVPAEFIIVRVEFDPNGITVSALF